MTDEELAENWVLENGFSSDCNNINSVEANGALVNAFFAGLKVGKPKWHKVADGDLPDNTDSVLSDKGVIVYYNFTHACWVDERASVEIDDVISWCEIPTFME